MDESIKFLLHRLNGNQGQDPGSADADQNAMQSSLIRDRAGQKTIIAIGCNDKFLKPIRPAGVKLGLGHEIW